MRRSEQEILDVVYRRSGQIRMRRHLLQAFAGVAAVLVASAAVPSFVRQLSIQKLNTADQPKTELASRDGSAGRGGQRLKSGPGGQRTDGGLLGPGAGLPFPGTSPGEQGSSTAATQGSLPPGSTSGGPAGSLDTTFGTGGKVTTDFGTQGGDGRAMAIQPDGRIVVAGYSGGTACGDGCSPPIGADFAVARYNANGTLDPTFGTGGKVTTNFGSGTDLGSAVALQPDGRIVVAGTSNNDFALARYNTNGTLDPTFNTDGKVTTNFGGSDYGYAVAIQPDGRIVVAGYSGNSTCSDTCSDADGGAFAVARYNTNGSLDSTFGAAGKVTTDFGAYDSGNAVAVQPAGRIVVAGSSSHRVGSVSGAAADFALARYNPNGSLDTTFNGTGKVTTDFGAGTGDFGEAVALQPDGRIVVAGNSNAVSCCSADFALARYNVDGSLDTTFGSSGKATTNFGGDQAYASAVALQPDGRIVVAGSSSGGTFGKGDFALARYNANGTLDLTFDTDGKVTTAIGSGGDGGAAVALQPDGRIVVAGFTGAPNAYHFAVVRYHG